MQLFDLYDLGIEGYFVEFFSYRILYMVFNNLSSGTGLFI